MKQYLKDKIGSVSNSKFIHLRQEAEDQLKTQVSEANIHASEVEMLKFIHEMDVLRIELEIQNEELLVANTETSAEAQKYAELYDFAPTGYFTLSRDGKIVELNHFMANILNNKRQNLVGCRFSSFVSSDTLFVFNGFLETIFKSDSKQWCDLKLLMGVNLQLHVNLTGLSAKNRTQCHVSLVDITDRKNAEIQLLRSEEKYRRIIETTIEGYWLINEQGRFLDVNSAYCNLIGYTKEELLMMSVFNVEVVESIAETEFRIKEIFKKGSEQFETIQRRKDGSLVNVEIHVSQFLLTENNCVAFVHDITERKRVEAELKRKICELDLLNTEHEKFIFANQELKQFAFTATHQLQEPIRTISNFTQIIEEDYSEIFDKKGLNHLHTIKEATQRMAGLMSTLMNYSILGRNKVLNTVNCNKLIDTVIADLNTLISECQAVIEVTEMPILDLYEIEVSQLFQNLITNAIKFQKKDRVPKISIRSERLDNKWQFAVQDNGIGIDSMHFEKIFNIFQRLHEDEKKYEGKGIGLAYCKKIVQLHHGEIWVESLPGEGSTFFFTIPNTFKPN